MARLTCPACQGLRYAYVAPDGVLSYHGEPCYLCKARGSVTKAQAAAYEQHRAYALSARDTDTAIWRLQRGPTG